ncbi:MAG: 5-formyltetrahydrofolate cyclo-ligase [Buchnera aphidicola (Brevicoryne brassicae)]|uniref:5-formyltetrahydrofolate cyclo-ligase n=1 Tax=Buchnera aphidicola (Brevicoryne brassicae) TaxID=911343 RepID=A0AAJ5PTV1_9GAMM|nr:5-formyltetrahydrofolate cyclo-ligase [Buchnera aphidicola]QCI19965.1 5-formyltetrahydrofolate cyclo-ligase [Buchnera aphidicola (Brevicoryne brassicae)]WAI18790.1 MAG: 5-formyltetrahydrofolate cyclo-ligase [Buchnera aphidicola (Brevicoryne brassicae)]
MLSKIFKHRDSIRTYIKIARKSLSITEQYDASVKISKIAYNCKFIYNSRNIALFLPFEGEINTYPLILKLWLNKKNVFVPVIFSFKNKKMLFVRLTSNSILYYNKYNILEPIFNIQDIISIYNLDTIIVPLVAFDKKGVRLGMGGGFYDVFLKNWYKKNFFPVGLSYNFQLVSNIPKQHWDVSLPLVLTPNKIWVF